MKKLLIAFALIISGTLYAATPTVDDKIKQTFKETFPKAEKVTWYENETHYEVLFENDLVKCRMWYNKVGDVVKTERYYREEGLCPFLLAKLKNKHSDKRVFGVTEINNDQGINYYIILEDDKKWYHIQADSYGNLSMQKKYNKA